MRVIKTVEKLQSEIKTLQKQGKTIGFVPTLGALHEGHMSLIRLSKKSSDVTLASIFVNPTQFNQASDLKKYPRTYKKDADLLKKEGCDILFYPSTEEVYPKGLKTEVAIDFGHLDKVLEGAFRSGHFEGVAQVVKRLLDITTPDHLYMGQKDFQQTAIIAHLIEHFKLSTKLIICPIIREKHGLAMSSRNERLKPSQRKKAAILYETLLYANRLKNRKSYKYIEEKALARIEAAGFKPEYFKIINGKNLRAASAKTKYVVACLAVWVDDVRLIDNKILKRDLS